MLQYSGPRKTTRLATRQFRHEALARKDLSQTRASIIRPSRGRPGHVEASQWQIFQSAVLFDVDRFTENEASDYLKANISDEEFKREYLHASVS